MNIFDDITSTIDLGPIFDLNLEEFKGNEINLKKKLGWLLSKSQQLAKEEKCLYCGQNVDSFCNSHSVPAFILRNIAINGNVYNNNKLVEIPLIRDEKGVNSSGTFRIICRDCDSKIFSDYENPSNYVSKPTSKMIAQIAMKNFLRSISKRKIEIQLYDLMLTEIKLPKKIHREKQIVNNLDLVENIKGYERAKRIDLKGWNEYYMFFCKRLDYIVPIAFQSKVTLTIDFNGNPINDIFNMSPDYETQPLHICVFPLEGCSMIFLFIDSKDKRYRQFYKQFNSLSLADKLAAINYIIFSYSEEVFINKNINELVLKNEYLIKASRKTSDIISATKEIDTNGIMKNNFDFSGMHSTPNLLSEEYKII